MQPKKIITGTAMVVLLFLFTISPALAGGWSVLTLDELPQDVQAGEPFKVQFMIRAHGITPASRIKPNVVATHTESNQRIRFRAVDLTDPGHYEAVVELPQAGIWSWRIDGLGEHPMPDLMVGLADLSTPGAQPVGPGIWVTASIMTILLAAGVGLFLFRRRRSLKSWVWGLVALPVLAAAVLSFNTQARSQEQTVTEHAVYENASVYDAVYGEALFIAKGCYRCHTNTRIPIRYFTINSSIGPNLTAYPTTAEYLQGWLKDPSAVKPDTRMPTLDLNDNEIAALISFLIEK